MLSIEKLSKIFNTHTILNAISLHIQAGEIAVLLGQSGVGKSTLLRILSNLETKDGGTITLDGTNLDPETMARQHIVGMVFQQFNLFEHLTVLENITLALEKVAHKTPEQAQQIAHKLLKQYHLETKSTVYVRQLSGGQKQRLAIARTLALEPKIVCLDEPTSALDPLLTTYVAHNIQELARQGYIVLVATHDTMLLEKLRCTIYLMEQGNIVECAQSDDFINNKSKYPNINAFIMGNAIIEN